MSELQPPLDLRPEIRAMLREFQEENLQLALPVVTLLGILLILSHRRFSDPLHAGVPGLVLLVVPWLAWSARGLGRSVPAWVLVAGCVLADLLVAGWGRAPVALCALFLPVGIAGLCLGLPSSVLVAAGLTALLLRGPMPLRGEDPNLSGVAILGVWGSAAVVWQAQRPLMGVVEWSWANYKWSRSLLEQARDDQVRLKQTLADLADANSQLNRLNNLAQGLRRMAEEARLAKQQFLANVSHELRTPLNMILGFAEMIMQAPETYGRELPPALLADLAVIWRNSQHLSELLDDVLDLSQIEAGRMALRKEYVALPEIIASAVEAVRPLYESKGLYLRTEVPKDLPEVFCDPTRIREVVLNLLSNAGRFTEAGGVCVRARQDGSEVLVSVADTGPGIASEDAPKVFQPFQQLDGSMRRRHAGSGLGLAISKSFVELHGGRMWFESQKGVGTTFFFRVPVSPPISGDEGVRRWFSPYWYYEERTRRSTVPVPPIRPRFVVVETGNSLGRLLRRYLDEAEVQSMASVDEAVAELQRVPTQALVINDAHAESILRHLSASGSLPRGTAAIACSIPGRSRWPTCSASRDTS